MPCGDGADARDGYRERGLATPVGDITPRMPKLRAGAYFPEGMIERCSRADRAVAAAVAGSWANGVSTGKMGRTARKMGMERPSRDRVGAMCRSLDAEVGELASRDLGGIEVPCLLPDATCVKRGRDGRARPTAVVAAIGVGSDGARRLLGIAATGTETHAGRLGFLSRSGPGSPPQSQLVKNRLTLTDWANRYNDFRIHSTLGHMSPVEFREAGLILS